MDNALKIAQNACGELGLPQPSQLAGGSADGLQILALLNREGNDLARMEMGWPELRGEQLITLVAGQQAYPFPSDILYYRPSTGWDRSTHWRMAGPISDREWQALRSGIVVASPRLRFRLYGGMLQIDPVPDSTDLDTIVFEYVSKNWCTDSSGTVPQSSFIADTDVPLLPSDLFVLGLKWRLLAARGFNYAEEKEQYEAMRDQISAQEQAPDVLSINRREARIGGIGFPQIPDINFPGR